MNTVNTVKAVTLTTAPAALQVGQGATEVITNTTVRLPEGDLLMKSVTESARGHPGGAKRLLTAHIALCLSNLISKVI